MQNRDQAASQDRDAGNLKPEKGYAFIDAIRIATDVGALGLGANATITRTNSMITAVTVEGFCSMLSLIVVVHEIVNVCSSQCYRRDGLTVESTNRAPTEYSTYLCFRMASILVSFVGMSLIAADLGADTSTAKSVIGIAAISLGIFASRALSSSKQKPAGITLQNDGGDIEMGLMPAPPPPPGRQNQFFQDQQVAPQGRAPQEPAAAPVVPPSKKVGRVKVKRFKKAVANQPVVQSDVGEGGVRLAQ